MKIILKCISFAILLSLLGPARAISPPPPAEKHACHDDAFRFCGKDIPDRAKIHLCLLRHVGQLSSHCRAIVKPR